MCAIAIDLMAKRDGAARKKFKTASSKTLSAKAYF
jgi:hypothetical protein